MTSAMLPPRSDFTPCSPITQDSASTTFDLPDPFGPTTHVIPGSRCRVVADAKDLNPRSVSVLRYTGAPYWPAVSSLWTPSRARRPCSTRQPVSFGELSLGQAQRMSPGRGHRRRGCRSGGGEPEGDLAGGGLHRVRAVDEVLDHLGVPGTGEIAADGAGGRRRRLGRAGQRAETLDDAVALDDRRHQRAGAHELQQRLEVRP